jgi:protease II
VPVKRDDYFYYTRTEEGKAYSIQCRKHGSLDAPEEILLDSNVLAEGQKYFRWETSPSVPIIGCWPIPLIWKATNPTPSR